MLNLRAISSFKQLICLNLMSFDSIWNIATVSNTVSSIVISMVRLDTVRWRRACFGSVGPMNRNGEEAGEGAERTSHAIAARRRIGRARVADSERRSFADESSDQSHAIRRHQPACVGSRLPVNHTLNSAFLRIE